MTGCMRIENLREPRVKPRAAIQSSKPSTIGPNSGIEENLWLDLEKRERIIETFTDEIIRNLSIVDGLAVRSQTSSFAFKGKPQNIREAEQQLQADYTLEGSVLRTGQQLRINVPVDSSAR